MLRRVELKELNLENTYFHFTMECNLERIEAKNLIPLIGENSAMIEDTKKIFFSVGASGVLKLHDVWLKWLMNRMFGEYNLRKKYDEEEYNKKIYSWMQEFLSKDYKNDEAKKDAVFTKYYHDMLECVYLELNISNGCDYDNGDYDEAKVRVNQNPDSVEYLFMKEIYGDYSNVDSNKMESWNMHTIRQRHIKPRFIRVIKMDNKDANVIEIIKYLYNNYKDADYDLLDDFMIWLKNNEER